MSQPPRYSTLYPSLPPSSTNPAVLILDDEPAPSSGHLWPPIPITSQDTTTSTPVGSAGVSRYALLAQQTLLLHLRLTPQPIFLLNSQPQPQPQLQSSNIYTYIVPAMLYPAPPPILWTQPLSMVMQPKYTYAHPPVLPVGTMQFWQQNPLPHGMRPGDSVLILPGA